MPTTEKEQAQEELLAKFDLTAPRVTPEMIDSMIKQTTFTLLPGKTAMICVLELNNGFKLFGKNTVVNPENFKLELAEKYSYEKAREQIWPFAGFLLAEDQHRGNNPLTEEQRKLPDHVQRVITEMYQVSSRLMGLTAFLQEFGSNPESFGDIPLVEINDLSEQRKHMTAYVEVLKRRLERAGV